ncbi:peptidase S24 [Massilia oculi]|uniref:Peptidase S24 n=2 Tax=Massilia oculi TaxID=945844 RepID=A0A2S2DDF4_9BURK|nr:peptidase S24 [Massilia oculi]
MSLIEVCLSPIALPICVWVSPAWRRLLIVKEMSMRRIMGTPVFPVNRFSGFVPDDNTGMSIGTRVKQARKAAKLTQIELAKKSNLKQSSISDLEVGKSQGTTNLASLAAALGVSALWLETGKGPMSPEQPPTEQFDQNVSLIRLASRPIPVISSVQAGALRDMENPYEPGDGYAVEYTEDPKLSRWAFCLDVEGMSMAPRFQPGDRLFVDPDRSPGPGNFVVARNGSNQATFKKYRPRGIDANGNEIFELVPLNDDFPTLRSDQETLVVIGVVTEVKQKLV